MNNIKTAYLFIAAGFAIFSMFFGSGNLVFPLTLGSIVEGNYTTATIGLLITGVFLPFLGLYAILLFGGNITRFFIKLDRRATFWIPLLMLALLGPFGVIPRSITVAHGSFVILFPGTPLWLFGIVMALAIYFLVIKRDSIVPIIGVFLTPFLLISLAAIVIFALSADPIDQLPPPNVSAFTSFKEGFAQGFFTMDLLAALFFASFVIHYMENKVGTEISQNKTEQNIFFGSMVLAATLLMLIYVAFVYLGVKYAEYLSFETAEQSLAIIAIHALGPLGGPIVTIAVILATLTTSVALTSISAEFTQEKIARNKIGYLPSVIILLLISYGVTYFKFSGIAALVGPILVFMYPALIVLTLANILNKKYQMPYIRTPFYITLLLTLAYYFY